MAARAAADHPDVADDVELADSVSTAMLVVLETLTPTERAVFVLREVFDVGYDEIADAVDKSPAAVRQIAHRARNHVEARQPREEVGVRQREAILDRFVLAVESGNLQALMDVLAPDVVLMTDGGGVKKAALRADPRAGQGTAVPRGAATMGGPSTRSVAHSSTAVPGWCSSSTARSTRCSPSWSRTAWSPVSPCATRPSSPAWSSPSR